MAKKQGKIKDFLKKAEESLTKKEKEKEIARGPEKKIKQSLKNKTPGKKEDKLDLILKNQELFSKDMREEKVARQDLKKIVDSLVDRQNNTENFLNTIVTKPAGNPEKEDTKAEPTPEELAKMTDQEKQKLLEQGKEQGKEQAKGKQAEGNPVLNPTAVWLLGQIIDAGKTIIPVAMQTNRSSGDGTKGMLDQIKIWGGIESALVGNFLSLFKMMRPGEREQALNNIVHSSPSPHKPFTREILE